MKKQFLLSALATIAVLIANAQHPHNFEWAKHLTENVITYPVRMIASPTGDVYTISSPEHDEDYDYYANAKNFISKINAQGDTLWTKQINNYNINTSNNDYSVYAEDLTLDNAGNLYIAGWFAQRVDFDPGAANYILSSDTWTSGFDNIYGRDAFVIKLNAQGNFVWAKKYSRGGAYNEGFFSLTVDNTGNIYAAGRSNTSANLGLLYKINAGNGNVIWHKDIACNKPRITLDNTNNLCLTGFFSGTVDFDPGATVYNLTSTGSNDVFVSRLDTAGHFMWATKLGGTGDDKAKSLTTDNAGNIFVTGYYTSTATYTPASGAPVVLPNAAGKNGFVAKLNGANGSFSWISSWRNSTNQQGSIDDFGKGIALDQTGNVYVTGTAHTNTNTAYYGMTNFGQQYYGYGSKDIMIFKLNNSDGNFAWINVIGGTAIDSGKDIALDASNNVYVTGLYNDRIYTGQTTAFQASVDFDPSAQGVHMLAGNTGQMANRFLLKLSLRSFTGISHSLCEGDEFPFDNDLLTNAGIYHDTLTNIAGYDSIITLTLNVLPVTGDSVSVTINSGDVYNFNGNILDSAGVYTHTLTNANGCDSVVVLTLSVDVVTGINETSGNKEFKLFPNPTTGMVYFTEAVNARITNALGQIIADRKNINSFDLSTQPAGVYFIILTDNKGQLIQQTKLVKEE